MNFASMLSLPADMRPEFFQNCHESNRTAQSRMYHRAKFRFMGRQGVGSLAGLEARARGAILRSSPMGGSAVSQRRQHSVLCRGCRLRGERRASTAGTKGWKELGAASHLPCFPNAMRLCTVHVHACHLTADLGTGCQWRHALSLLHNMRCGRDLPPSGLPF
jgi:hypothetical protein